jgi:hypothetical protein
MARFTSCNEITFLKDPDIVIEQCTFDIKGWSTQHCIDAANLIGVHQSAFSGISELVFQRIDSEQSFKRIACPLGFFCGPTLKKVSLQFENHVSFQRNDDLKKDPIGLTGLLYKASNLHSFALKGGVWSMASFEMLVSILNYQEPYYSIKRLAALSDLTLDFKMNADMVHCLGGLIKLCSGLKELTLNIGDDHTVCSILTAMLCNLNEAKFISGLENKSCLYLFGGVYSDEDINTLHDQFGYFVLKIENTTEGQEFDTDNDYDSQFDSTQQLFKDSDF